MADVQLTELLRRQKVIRQKLTRIEHAIQALPDTASRAVLQVHLEHAEKAEVDVLAFEEDLLATVSEDAFETYAADCTILIDRCTQLKANLKSLIEPTLRQASQDVGVATLAGAHCPALIFFTNLFKLLRNPLMYSCPI